MLLRRQGMTMYRTIFLTIIACYFSISAIANPLDLDRRIEVTVHDHYSAVIEHYQNKDWSRLERRALDILQDFPHTPFATDAHYYLGVAYFQLEDYELANANFTSYLKEDLAPKFFEEVIQFKFEIACRFEDGAKKHLFGWKRMPKWINGYEEAIKIYDEVVTTLPRDDLAAQSLFRKGSLLLSIEEYKKCIETYQTLIRRFPKHPLAPQGYLGVANAYAKQCAHEFNDGQLLDLAEINLRQFRAHFPSEPTLMDAEKILHKMKEGFASDLFEIGEFYRRTNKGKAAAIYYGTILKRFPETKFATRSKKKIDSLRKKGIDTALPEALIRSDVLVVDRESSSFPLITSEDNAN